MTIQPGDNTAAGKAGRGHLRASHADREHAIEVLQAAYVQGMLTEDELDARLGQALTSRTYAGLAALTADIPPGTPAARPERPPARVRRRPLARAAAKSGTCLIIAFPAFWVGSYFDPFGPWRAVMDVLAVCGLWTAVGIMVYAVFTAWDQRSSSRRRLPPRPGPGGQAIEGERHDGTGQGPMRPGPRTDQTHADLRAYRSPGQRHTPPQAGRAPGGARPAPGSV